MLLVGWNVAGRKTRVQEQAERVLGLEPDVVCLAPRRQALGPLGAGGEALRPKLVRTCVRGVVTRIEFLLLARIEVPRGRAGTGRQDRFRTGCSEERVGSTPSARTR